MDEMWFRVGLYMDCLILVGSSKMGTVRGRGMRL